MSHQVIDQAINENKPIEFNYTKYSGETSKRKVSNISYSNEYGGYGYNNDHIKGYCHLRREDRTFRISRMSNIKIVSTIIPSYSSSIYPTSHVSDTPMETKSKEGCYIATMVYGDYNHPKVIILRKYRDNKLSKTPTGKVFIKLYYLLSPKIVNLLQGHKKTNRLIKLMINKFIKYLS